MYIQAYSNNLASSTLYGVYESTSEVLLSSIGLYYPYVQPRSNIADKANASCRQYCTLVTFADSIQE